MKRVGICNLGCAKNRIDGERMVASLAEAGYRPVDDLSQAEVIIVNTCAFIREAKEEAIEAILSMARYKKLGACTTLAVAGCFSERYRNEVKEQFPEVDAWIGVATWADDLRRYLRGPSAPARRRRLTDRRAAQYLKIAEGCSNRCAYCAIPSIRGPFRSRPLREIVDEAQWLYDRGARECILVSQDTSRYGRDIGLTLPRLLESLLAHTRFPWIRMMYLNPSGVDDSLLELVSSENRLCSYFDIPVQHIADPILRAMNRRTTSRDLYRVVERVRTRAPGAALRTTFIAGFPGETERHFDEVISFVKFAMFNRLGVFAYSPEEGTPAFSLRPRPSRRTAARRCDTIMEAQREISRGLLSRRVGETVTVMIDGEAEGKPGVYAGRTEFDAPEVDGTVFVRGAAIGRRIFTSVRIVSADDHDLYAEKTAPRRGCRSG